MTNFQSPEALPPGNVSVGGGLAYGWSSLPEANLLLRYGLFDNVDVGAKLTLPELVTADVKWQFAKTPFSLAFDVGGSYGHTPFIVDVMDEAKSYTVYPELLVGSDRFHAAVRALMVHSDEIKKTHSIRLDSTTMWYPQVFVGGSSGDRFRVISELSLTFGLWNRRMRPNLGIGVAFQYGPGASSVEDEFLR
jgi:hypothetical protein